MDAPTPLFPPQHVLAVAPVEADHVAPAASGDSDDSDQLETRAARARLLQIARQRRYRERQQTAASATQRRARELLSENAALERAIAAAFHAPPLA